MFHCKYLFCQGSDKATLNGGELIGLTQLFVKADCYVLVASLTSKRLKISWATATYVATR